MNLDEDEPAPHIPENLATEDKWILSQFNSLVKAVTNSLENYELGIAVQNLYDFIWDVFCDWYIEIAKIRLNGDNEEGKKTARAVLVYVMSNTLKLLHPFMPFITEEIWLALPHDGESIMISEWCKYDEALNFPVEEEAMNRVMSAIKAIRNRRAEMNVPPSKKAKLYIATKYIEDFTNGSVFMNRLASASEIEIGSEFEVEGSVSVITESAKIFIPLNELVDFTAEKARLQKELEAAKKDLEFVENKLNNPGFMAKAPEKVVAAQREAQAKHAAKIAMLEESISKLQ
jgi:valyl-tRNA synthetase